MISCDLEGVSLVSLAFESAYHDLSSVARKRKEKTPQRLESDSIVFVGVSSPFPCDLKLMNLFLSSVGIRLEDRNRMEFSRGKTQPQPNH
jgi:hypothetical protein